MQEKIDRNTELVKDKNNGMTYKELMEKYKISINAITRILYRFKIREELQKKG
jgi:Mor family transcriptional regulator